MNPKRLLSLRRYARCRRIFVHPCSAHLKLAYLPPRVPPFAVTFKNGEVLRHDLPQSMRELWDELLQDDRAGDVTFEEGLLKFQWQEREFAVRPNTLDAVIFCEVYVRDEYRLDGRRDLGCVVDLGAQAGMFATRAASIAERVISVEASPDNLELLQRNTGTCENVTVVHQAVGRESGQILKLYAHPGNTGGHSLDREFILDHMARLGLQGQEPESVEVRTISLPDLFSKHGVESCGLLKCDIEGAEYDVFAGADDETLQKIHIIAMELHEVPGADDSRIHSIRDRLKRLGFSVEIVDLGQDRAREPWAVMLFADQPG